MPLLPFLRSSVKSKLFSAILCCFMSSVAISQNLTSVLDTITKTSGNKIEQKVYYGNKNLREVIRKKNGLLNGKQELYYAEGTMASSRDYREGHLDGEVKEWDLQGRLTEKKTLHYDAVLKKSVYDGLYFQFENNILRKKISYKNDKKNGKSEEYYANGVIKTKSNYIDDRLTGQKLDFNNLGQLICKSNYSASSNEPAKEAQLEGEYFSYSNEGILIASGKYLHNKKEGLWKEYTNKGVLISEIEYKEGKRHGLASYYYDTGKLKSNNTFYELITVNGKPFRNVYDGAKTDYYQSGRVQLSEHYKLGVKDGVFERYYETGVLSDHSEYQNGLLVGIENYWDIKGTKTAENKYEIVKKDTIYISQKTDTSRAWKDAVLVSEVPFKSGKEDGIRKSYFPSGKLSSLMNYKNGLLQGETIEYYENGQVKSKRNYYTPTNNYAQSTKTVGWSSNYESDGTLISKSYNDSTEKVIFQRRCYGGKTNLIEAGKCVTITFFPEGKLMSLQIKDSYQRVVNGISFYRNGKIRKIEIQDPETKQFSGLNYADEGEFLGCSLEINNAPDSLLSSNKTIATIQNVFDEKIIENKLFSDPILTGRYELKYANGKLMGTLEFENDLPNGSFVFYDPFKGDTLLYKYFANGVQSDYYVEKFAGKTVINRGRIPSINSYGWEERYSTDGIPMSRRVFTKDQTKQIETTEYYPDGKLKSINNYEKDTYSNYSPEGKITYHTIAINDSLKHYREYFPGTNQVKTSRYILNGKQDSLYSTYYPTGKPLVYQYYKNDKREGLFQRFDENGELTYWGNYINDLEEGVFINRKAGKNDTLQFIGGKLQIKPRSIECACVDTTYSTSKVRFAQSVSSLIEYPQLLNYISPSFKLKDSLNFNSLFFTNLQTDNNRNAGFASFNLQMFKDFSIMIPADEQLIVNFNPCRTQGYISKMDMMVHYEEEYRNTYVSFYPKRVAVSIAKGPLKSSNTNYPFFTCLFNVDAVEYRYNKEIELKESKTPEYCFTPARLKDFLDIKITKGQTSLFNSIEPFLDRNFQDLSGIKYAELNSFFGIVAQEADLTFPLKTNKGLNTFYAKSSRTLLGGKFVSGNIIIPCKKISDDGYEIIRDTSKENFSLKELKTNMINNGFTRVKSYFEDSKSELTIYYFAE